MNGSNRDGALTVYTGSGSHEEIYYTGTQHAFDIILEQIISHTYIK